MRKISSTPKPAHPLIAFLWDSLLGGARPLVEWIRLGVENRLEHFTQTVEDRLLRMVFHGSTLLFSLLFMGFGFLFVLIDDIHLSRGAACLCCGMGGFLTLLASIQIKKQRGVL